MFTITAGESVDPRPIHAAWYMFSMLSATFAISATRTGAPLRYAITIGSYSGPDSNWSFASIVNDCRCPSSVPFAWSTFADASAVRTSSRLSPYAASAVGFA